ncbi:MAG: hypothetical protein IR153_04140 [Flavobacterium sp.]|nr:hypothetical protein [Flavobacterium sp.]
MKKRNLPRRVRHMYVYETTIQKTEKKESNNLLMRNLLETNSRLLKSLDVSNLVIF